MPTTASSQTQSRSSAKARPTSNVRTGSLIANTPVLFRLPAIATPRIEDLAATISEAAASLPTATLAAVAVSTAAASSAKEAVMPSEQVKSINAGDALQAAPKQTWWEHWSSGIVLIVLLIALATASILAWQGSGKPNTKLMADTKPSNAQGENDLSTIEVPKLEVPKLEFPRKDLPASKDSNAAADKLESVQGIPLDQNNDEDSLIPSESKGLALDNPSTKLEKPEKPDPATEPASYATASLGSPIVNSQEPLFRQEAANKPNISAQPASNPSPRKATSAEPDVWDSSKDSPADGVHNSSKPLSLELTKNTSTSSAEMPTLSNKPTGKPNNPITTLVSEQKVASTPSNPSEPSTAVPKEMQYAAKTSTPEMDQAAIRALYREFTLSQQSASSEKYSNRYSSDKTVATQQPNTQSLSQQQPALSQQQPVGNNNYTLQGAQNYAPNATAQNPANQQHPANQQSQALSVNSANLPYPNGQQYQVPQNGGTQLNQSSSTLQNAPSNGTRLPNSPSYPSVR